jgi:hypothetical protein
MNSNIMKIIRYSTDIIEKHFESNKIATMPELKMLLGTSVDMTILRKLHQLSYHSSYSHRGKYYTLAAVAQFDKKGLWAFNLVNFSVYGTLVNTCLHFVDNSPQGYCVSELNRLLDVETKQTLLGLCREERLVREKIAGQYVYFTSMISKQKGQIALRKDYITSSIHTDKDSADSIVVHELKAAIALFHSLLDEKHRRLYAGLEALKIGHGGDAAIARLLGVDPRTVARGRQELLTGPNESDSLRKPGGGRKTIKKTTLE